MRPKKNAGRRMFRAGNARLRPPTATHHRNWNGAHHVRGRHGDPFDERLASRQAIAGEHPKQERFSLEEDFAWLALFRHPPAGSVSHRAPVFVSAENSPRLKVFRTKISSELARSGNGQMLYGMKTVRGAISDALAFPRGPRWVLPVRCRRSRCYSPGSMRLSPVSTHLASTTLSPGVCS